jgi:cobalt transporter subunit CbtA
MIARLFWVALIAGAVAGLVAAALQAVGVWPLIAIAETFEVAESVPSHAPSHAPSHDSHAHAHDWSPEGAWRIGLSVLFDMLAGIGFALLANAALLLARTVRAVRLDWRLGLGLGAAGFAAFALAPALGLAPALPGMAEGDLLARQSWWIATAIATLAGVALMALSRGGWMWALGLLVLVLPHAVGAPGEAMGLVALMSHSGPLGDGGMTAELAQRFALASLGAAAVFWAVLGIASAGLQRRYLEIA